MKKIIFGLICWFALAFGTIFADLWWFTINNYTVDINVQKDGNATIIETIEIDFFEERHGIYRDIPLGGDFPILIENIIVNETNEITQDDSQVSIKIWNANEYISGVHTYKITYDVFGLASQFSWHQELYRNIIGTNRATSIKNVDFSITLPKTANISEQNLFFYAGRVWSTTPANIDYTTGTSTIIGQLKTPLQNYEWFTIELELPDNFFTRNTEGFTNLQQKKHNEADKIYPYIESKQRWKALGKLGKSYITSPISWVTAIILITLIAIFGIPTKRHANIIPQYESPKDLNPTEVGILVDGNMEPRDLLALFYYRAAKGLLQITMTEQRILIFKQKLFTVTPQKHIPTDAPKFEQFIRNELFNQTSQLTPITIWNPVEKQRLIKIYRDTTKKLKAHLQNKKRYHYNPLNAATIRALSFMSLWILCAIGWSLVKHHDNVWPTIAISIIILIIIQIKFVRHIIRPTATGAQLVDHAKGYKKFLKQVDSQKLETLLKDDPLYVDKTLAYAVIFGIETEFIKKIAPLLSQTQVHTRYHGSWADLWEFSKSFASTFTSATGNNSSSGGGGNSGGWGGGGGGWSR